jgi:hypothetical protein
LILSDVTIDDGGVTFFPPVILNDFKPDNLFFVEARNNSVSSEIKFLFLASLKMMLFLFS